MTPGYKHGVKCSKLTAALCLVVPVLLLFSVYITAVDRCPSSRDAAAASQSGHVNVIKNPAIKGLVHGGIYEPPVLTNSTKRAAIVLLVNDELPVPFTPVIKQIHRVLSGQGLRYGLFTVKEYRLPHGEYSDDFMQNWGALFNAAVLEILKYNTFDCFFFHDFSILTIVFNSTDYRCPEEGVVVQSSSKSETVSYEDGYLAFTKDDFMRMNGFSNCYPYNSTIPELALRMNNFNLNLKTPTAATKPLIPNDTPSFNATRLARDGLSSVEYVLQAVEVSKLHTSYQFSLKEKNYIEKVCKL